MNVSVLGEHRRAGIGLLRRNLAALLILLSCSTTAQAQQQILLLGDSLSAAYGIPREQGWVELLRQTLPAAVTLRNASVSGETTAGGLARLPALLAEEAVDILIIELGGNDGLRGYPLASIRKNLQQIIKLGQQAGAEVLLLGMRIPSNYGRHYTEGFHRIYQGLADQHQLPLVPFLLEGIATREDLMQDDGIHPTAEAQPKILALVAPVLKPLLDQHQSARASSANQR